MAWLFGALLIAFFASIPFLRPALAKTLSGPGLLRGPVMLSGFLTLYAAVFLFLVVELLLALDGQRIWPLHVNRPFAVLAFFCGLFAFLVLLLTPLIYLGSAARRAGVRFASTHRLTFVPEGGPWSISADLAPWTLQWRVDLEGGGFIAAATTSHLSKEQRVAHTYRTVGMIPGACAVRGVVTNVELIWRKPGAEEQEISVRGGVRFLVPAAVSDSWRILLEQVVESSPHIASNILYLSCDGIRAAVALGATLRDEAHIAELEGLLRGMVEKNSDRKMR
jgi:hypothetical protein